jgi:hypothetical protein
VTDGGWPPQAGPPSNPAAVAAGVADLVETLAPIIEGLSSYRDRAVATGFTPAAAEQMAVALHRQIVARLYPSGYPSGEPSGAP